MSIALESVETTLSTAGGLLVSYGNATAATRERLIVPTPPSMKSGPWICDSWCFWLGKVMTVELACDGSAGGTKLGLADSFIDIGMYQFDALNVTVWLAALNRASGTPLTIDASPTEATVCPSLRTCTVTSAVGAAVRTIW